jgi:hypothetical protein
MPAVYATPRVSARVAPARALPEEHHQDLLEGYRFLRDWVQVAHAKIKRRDYLVRLGLAKRKPPQKKAPVVPATPAVPAAAAK